MRNNRIILRTAPMSQFYAAIETIRLISSQKKYTIVAQEDIIPQFNNKYNLKIIKIRKGKLGFIDGVLFFKFRVYDEIAMPLSSYEMENFLNLFLFILPVFSKSYLFIFSNKKICKTNIIGFYVYIIKIVFSIVFIKMLNIIRK